MKSEEPVEEPAITRIKSYPSERPRACNILFRTGHIGATAALFGGQVFNVATERLLPWLYASVLTGVALVVIESLPDWRWCGQGSSVMTLMKLMFYWC